MSFHDIDRLAEHWRHAGLKVRGAWGVDTTQTTLIHRHPDHWQLLLVHNGCARYETGTSGLAMQQGDAAIFRPGDATRASIDDHMRGSVVLFSPLMGAGVVSGLDLLTLPFVTHYPADGLLDGIIASYREDHWQQQRDAMEARFVVDRLLWDIAVAAYESGQTKLLQQTPRWLLELVTLAERKSRDPTFSIDELVQ